jgi:hypothetical protein
MAGLAAILGLTINALFAGLKLHTKVASGGGEWGHHEQETFKAGKYSDRR